MGCNCTANLRADIIKRFFANQFNGKEFALELIRIVECQQTVMSRELEDWFKVWFRFPQDMLEEFLACVMKRQQTMSDRLQKVIRARFFPTDQRMADDFIRVVLCGCCPTLCGTDVNIINTSDQYTVDGWYAQVDASNLVYMEGGVITDTVPCASGIAAYAVQANEDTAFILWFNGSSWEGMATVHFEYSGSGLDFNYEVLLNPNTSTLLNTLVQITYDGTTFITASTFDNETGNGTISASSNIFKYRIVNTWDDCPYYMENCPYFEPTYWEFFVVGDTNIGGNHAITCLASNITGMTVDIEGTTDGGTTWSVIAADVPASEFDGADAIEVSVPFSETFKARLKISSPLDCVSYSVESQDI
jgi:hypothetical protein